ncbi:MAG: HAMP domain-containing protein, partial [Hyphomicrobiaceae bacterium]|nr:HAMP domain-containing protein [Hyphomicrobiaceae bacterium]
MALIRETTTATAAGKSVARSVRERLISNWTRAAEKVAAWSWDILPKGLYSRALIIIIAPIVMLAAVVTFVFMERHWQQVNQRLSEQTARNIAALIDVYDNEKEKADHSQLVQLARDRLNLSMQILPRTELPPPLPKPFFSQLDRTLSRQVQKQISYPFWIDTLGQSSHVEIRVLHDDAILRFVVTRNQTSASNSHIFLLWMVGSSVILLTVAILFLRNQIKPILRLAEAADALGKGRPIPEDFRPRGAREVRQAAQAFIEMSDRIRTHVDQRTTMLAGVSHDLRTVLTRFKLELALMGNTPEAKSMAANVNEMQHMLEDYLAFARGDGGEEAKPTNVRELLEEVVDDASVYGKPITLKFRKHRTDVILPLKRNAFKRAVTNLVSNSIRFGDEIIVRAATESEWLRVEIDDDGPGIPAKERENVFRPFYRIDSSRNQDTGHSGLGLAIAR